MRTLFEIIDSVKAGEQPEYDELRYALLALDAASTLACTALIRDKRRELNKESACKTMHNALNNDPTEYLGWGYNPDNPDYQKFRKAAIGIYDKAIDGISGGE